MEKIIFSADLHGNISQFEKTLRYAVQQNADAVVYGGDITPKNPSRRTPPQQREFLENELFPLFDETGKQTSMPILMILGNDDFRSNHEFVTQRQDFHNYRMIDQHPYVTKNGFYIFGYNYIPSTPFQYKCWEKRDLATDTDFSRREDTRIKGVISKGGELLPYSLEESLDAPSIEEDLQTLTQNMPSEKLVIVSHAPPANTVCDICKTGEHVGSEGLLKFIKEHQPYLTLHGHIHETVDLSGDYKETIGRTSVATVGNDHKPLEPYILEIALGDEPGIERKLLT